MWANHRRVFLRMIRPSFCGFEPAQLVALKCRGGCPGKLRSFHCQTPTIPGPFHCAQNGPDKTLIECQVFCCVNAILKNLQVAEDRERWWTGRVEQGIIGIKVSFCNCLQEVVVDDNLSGMLLIKTRNVTGPRHAPWGTPAMTLCLLVWVLSTVAAIRKTQVRITGGVALCVRACVCVCVCVLSDQVVSSSFIFGGEKMEWVRFDGTCSMFNWRKKSHDTHNFVGVAGRSAMAQLLYVVNGWNKLKIFLSMFLTG